MIEWDRERWVIAGPAGRARLSPHQAVAIDMLTDRPGRRVDRERLMHALFAQRTDGGPDAKSLDVMMHRLRRRLAKVGVPEAIATVWGAGWVWAAGPVERRETQ